LLPVSNGIGPKHYSEDAMKDLTLLPVSNGIGPKPRNEVISI